MPKFDDILKIRDEYADRVSTQTRTVALGILAISWGLLISDIQADAATIGVIKDRIILVAGIVISVLFFDFLQCVFSYSIMQLQLKSMEKREIEEEDYKKGFFYYLSYLFYWLKQVALIYGTILFIICLYNFHSFFKK